jgi:hypothetical protein
VYLRQDFGELARRGHDKALICARPRDEMLYALVLQHAAIVLAGMSQFLSTGIDPLVELVDECSLDDLWLLCGGGGTNCWRGASIHSATVVTMQALDTVVPLRHGTTQNRGPHDRERRRGDVHGISRRCQGRGTGGGWEDRDGLVHPLMVRIQGEGASTGVCC